MSTRELSQSVPTRSKTSQGLYEALLQSRLNKQDVTEVDPSLLSSSRIGVVNISLYSRPLVVPRGTKQSISGMRSDESASTATLMSDGDTSNMVNSAIIEIGDSELKGKKKICEQEMDISAKKTRAKKTRAADVHNLSEKRRRDRLNEKITTLKGLIPNCNKVNKASILDEAIEYVKTLQLQLQMMNKQCQLIIPLMMPPVGMQLPQMPTMLPFSAMNTGMRRGTGLSYRMGMCDSSNVQHFPVPPVHEQIAQGFKGMQASGSRGMQASNDFPMYVIHGQGLPMHMPVHPPTELPTTPGERPTKVGSVTEISMPTKDQQHQSAIMESTEKGITNETLTQTFG